MTDEAPVMLCHADLGRFGMRLTLRRIRTLIREGDFPAGIQLTKGGRMFWVDTVRLIADSPL